MLTDESGETRNEGTNYDGKKEYEKEGLDRDNYQRSEREREREILRECGEDHSGPCASEV